MSVVLNDKPRQSTLKWRWPLSRQLTLSVATLAVLAGRLVGGRGAAAD
ncbi:Taurine transport system permease TauC [Klebsiella pneumoniae]|nr:Taurine transport system permease TauC [Klebsiella pneumoniae]